jgi:PAS domain S-box-containing protein
MQARMRHKDGSWRDLDGMFSNLAHDSAIGGIIVNYHDITQRKRREDELCRFRAAMDATADAIYLMDPAAMRVVDVNEAACRMLGYTRDEILTLALDVLYTTPPDVLKQAFEAMVAAGTGPTIIETHHRRKDGSLVPVEVTRRALRSGDAWIMVGVARDISERRRAETDLRGYAKRLEALRDLDLAILEAHSPREIVGAGLKHLFRLVPYWRATVMLFDLAANEVTVLETERAAGVAYGPGSRLTLEQYGLPDLVTLKSGAACVVSDVGAMPSRPAIVEALREKGMRSYVRIPLRVEGALLGALNLGSNETGYFTEAYIDIARTIADQLAIGLQQAILREKVEQHSAELEQRVRERTAQLSVANAELENAKVAAESANRAKSAFLAMMSHEIRTPMNAVTGMLELLGMSRLDAEQAKMLDVVSESARALLAIVNDVLDISKIEAGRLEIDPKPAQVRDIVESIAQVFRDGASRKGLLLHSRTSAAVPAVVRCDALRVKQILSNLVSNAIKFTDRGEIEIEVDAAPGETGKVELRIEVRDSGIGIGEADQAKLFQPFVQVEMDASRRFGGSGLGLAICRRLANLMGGELTLVSALGKGSTVALSIPVAVADAEDLPLAAQATAAVEAKDETQEYGPLLVCDDNALNRNVALRQLTALGYTADTADDGLEAMRKWETGDYALMLLDCQMPHLSGYDVAQRIREVEAKHPERARTIILAYTANVIQEDRERCFAAGMDDVVGKPAGLQILRETLGSWLKRPAGVRTLAARPDAVRRAVGEADAIESPIDWSRLKEISGGEPQFEREILLGFNLEKKTDVRRIAELIPEGDLAEVARLAHRIKGAARTAAATDLGVLCEELETCARAGDRQAAIALKDRLQRRFDEVSFYIERRYG